MSDVEAIQRRTCEVQGVEFTPPLPGSKVGIALRTMGCTPVLGIRHPATETTCGWYLLAGEERSDDPDYFEPLCVEHVAEHCPLALPFLALPPGWWFRTNGCGEDFASFDATLLAVD